MSRKRIEYLVGLYFSNTITEIEKEELAGCIVQLSDEQIKVLLEKVWTSQAPDNHLSDDLSDKIINSLFNAKSSEQQDENIPFFLPRKGGLVWWKIPAVAACILLLVLTVFFWPATSKKLLLSNNAVQQKPFTGDVKPGGQKALLVLADGTRIVLDSASSGLLAQQGSVQVKKLSNGKIAYTTNGHPAEKVLYNTMSTPTGGIYQLILPDETAVWLNSASSIRYPTAFGAAERRVEITGEVYFEVTKNLARPFIVTINKAAEIKVLGTHFNVNAYNDESEIKTTVLEGAVNVSQGSNGVLIVPGQQAQINKSGMIKRVKDVDLEETVAWKNGNFLFNSAPLPAVLRQAARWYSLDIVYEGKIPDDKFSGQVSRSVNLSSLLKWMQWSDVHFKLEGRQLIIKN